MTSRGFENGLSTEQEEEASKQVDPPKQANLECCKEE